MLHWVGHHFADFDTDDEGMISFLDRFEEYCKEDVSIGEGWGRDREGGGLSLLLQTGFKHQLNRGLARE